MEKEETVGQFEGATRNRKRNAHFSAENHTLDFGTKLPKTQTASPYLHRRLTCVGVSSASSHLRRHLLATVGSILAAVSTFTLSLLPSVTR